MRCYCSILLTFAILCGNTKASDLSDYLLRLTEAATGALAETRTPVVSPSNTIEMHVTANKPFNVRTVINGCQYIVYGVMREAEDKEFSIEYSVDIAMHGQNPPPRVRIKGTVAGPLQTSMRIAEANQSGAEVAYKDGVTRELTLFPFHPTLGFRDKSSGWAVRLVDAEGRPVPDVEVWLGVDWESDKIIGPAKSDTAGVARFSEGREVLPIFAVFAEASKGQLKGSANLDRGRFYGSNCNSIEPFTIEMKSPRAP